MTREELDGCWFRQEPIEGVAFMLDDPVRLVAGPREGQSGTAVALLTLVPEPAYTVELGSGEDVTVAQSHLRSALAGDPRSIVAEVQHWYATQTDGDWEHSYGIRIATLDNPGWSVDVDLVDTPLAEHPFEEVSATEPVRDWMMCRVKDGQFQARGGPFMLDRMLGVFAAWVRSAQSFPVGGAVADHGPG